MGLRLRLNLLLTLIFSLALALAMAHLLASSRRAVIDELRASTEFASSLVRGLVASGGADAGDASLAAAIERLDGQAPLRHLRISMPRSDADEARAASGTPAHSNAPDWFHRLVRPDERLLTEHIAIAGGEIRIVADPDAEIGEAWRETRGTVAVLLLAFLGSNAVAFGFLGYALGPLRKLSAALEGVQQGHFATRLPRAGLPDIDAIVERFNDMTRALERSERDNADLAQRSIAIQEDERRYLAHELHDELGQSITAIKALAVSIQERADGVLGERAGTIAAVSSDIYARVRQMMTRLHPVVLDELGLVAALELMVDDWNSRHEDCFCEFDCPRDLPTFDQQARIALYRIVQEALTNIARHAAATSARVQLVLVGGAQAPLSTLRVTISDNGCGFDAATRRRGLGLRGIHERVTALHGTCALHGAAGQGTRITVEVPLPQPIGEEQDDDDSDADPARR